VDPTSTTTRVLEWLLDLEHIRLGRDAPLSLGWQAALPLWFLVPLGALTIVLISVIYRREGGSNRVRVFLATVRILLVALIIAMLCQPVLTLQRERIEPSYVALLIDTSASMGTTDVYDDADRARHVAAGAEMTDVATLSNMPRIDLVGRALRRNDDGAIRAMLAHNRLEVYSFGRSVVREVSIADTLHADDFHGVLDRLVCDRPTTNVPAAVLDVLRQTDRGQLAAIVLASDGRTTEPADLSDAISAARAQQVPIYAVLIGSAKPRRDLSIEPVAAAKSVFLKDSVAVRARILAAGLQESTDVVVQLVRQPDDAVIAKTTITLDPDIATKEVDLRFKPERKGRRSFILRVVAVPDERETDNNEARLQFNVIDRKVRVLFVDGRPRYEYRYLKNALLREPTIRSSCLLLSADAGFAQEGTDPIRRFPETPDELGAYDVVLFGDVDPRGDWLSLTQQEMLVDFVSQRGGGFGLIAGTRYAPSAYADSPLAKLIPVRIDPDPSATRAATATAAYQPKTTPEGANSTLLRFLGTEVRPGRSGPSDGEAADDNDSLPPLYWIARTLGPKPGAEVLAEHPDMETADGLMPLLVMGRYGAGKVFFSATDETWRWRRSGGDWMFDAFWLQVCRALMKPAHLGNDARAIIRTDRRRYRFGQRVELQLEVFQAGLLESLGQPGNRGEVATVLVLGRDDVPEQRVKLTRIGSSSRVYEGGFVPSHAGSFAFVLDAVLSSSNRNKPLAVIHVGHADPEMRESHADHDALRRLAESTGGAVVELDEIANQAGAIVDRSVRIPDDFTEPLWDSKLVLAFFVLMIGVEWVGRKLYGML